MVFCILSLEAYLTVSNFINLQNIDGKVAYLITILSKCDGLTQSNVLGFFSSNCRKHVFFPLLNSTVYEIQSE